MRLSISIGDVDKHLVEFTWGQLFGSVKLAVDGVVVYRGKPLAFDEVKQISNPYLYLYRTYITKKTPNQLTRSWDFEVGTVEKHRIHIDKIRPKLFAGFRPSLFRVLVDDRLVEECVGY